MLVLTSAIGKKLIINNSIIITIFRICDNEIKLGIEAPLNVPVDRLEVYEKKKKSKFYKG